MLDCCEKKKLFKSKGQTTVEYMLLILVAVILVYNFIIRAREELLAKDIPCPSEDQSLICKIGRVTNNLGTTDPSFRFFRLPR